jgi:putative Ca2+/H+ antiporter (TMEM165/GDT1 family)
VLHAQNTENKENKFTAVANMKCACVSIGGVATQLPCTGVIKIVIKTLFVSVGVKNRALRHRITLEVRVSLFSSSLYKNRKKSCGVFLEIQLQSVAAVGFENLTLDSYY